MAAQPSDRRVALISGGGRGIGASISRVLAAEGYDIAINYNRKAEHAQETAEAVRALGRRALLHQASIDDVAACQDLVAATVAEYGRLDILVNNAGISSLGRTLGDTEPAEIEKVMRVHTFGAFYLTHAALPHLLQAPRGDIIFLSSVATKIVAPNSGPYTMAKAATEAMAVTWAKELNRKNVFVNIVAPGLTATDMGFKLARATRGVQNEIEELDAQSAFGHVCRPEEIANVIAFLVSPKNSYITGERFYVEGANSGTTGTKY